MLAYYRLKWVKLVLEESLSRREVARLSNHSPFDLLCKELGIIHYLIDPGKPIQNGKIERFHKICEEDMLRRKSRYHFLLLIKFSFIL